MIKYQKNYPQGAIFLRKKENIKRQSNFEASRPESQQTTTNGVNHRQYNSVAQHKEQSKKQYTEQSKSKAKDKAKASNQSKTSKQTRKPTN